MSSQNNGARFFTGLVTGGVISAGLALLLTSQSGEGTQGQIRDESLELKDGAAESLAEASHHVQVQAASWQENGRRYVIGAIKRSKDRIIRAVSQS
jgi:gas vesicle protein